MRLRVGFSTVPSRILVLEELEETHAKEQRRGIPATLVMCGTAESVHCWYGAPVISRQ